jgi:hypothetical protein
LRKEIKNIGKKDHSLNIIVSISTARLDESDIKDLKAYQTASILALSKGKGELSF